MCVALTIGTLFNSNGVRTTILNQILPSLSFSSPTCTAVGELRGIRCTSVSFSLLGFLSGDSDTGDRRIGPVQVYRKQDTRTSFSVGPFSDLCAKRFYYGRFHALVVAGYDYDITFTGTHNIYTLCACCAHCMLIPHCVGIYVVMV